VLDCALLVVSAAEGIEAQTEVLWRALQKLEIPTIIFINKIDRSAADIAKVLTAIKEKFSEHLLVMQEVCGQAQQDVSILPMSSKLREEAVLTLSIHKEEMLEKLLTQIDDEFLDAEIRRQNKQRLVFPVLFGSALKNVGIKELFEALFRYLPPNDFKSEHMVSGIIYKVEHRADLGKICHVKLYGGRVSVRDSLAYTDGATIDKVKQIKKAFGGKLMDVSSIEAGDIGVFTGLAQGKVGDIFGDMSLIPQQYTMAEPLLHVKVTVSNVGEYPKLKLAMDELCEEDPTLNAFWQADKQEMIISIIGVVQLEVLGELLKERFGLTVGFSAPSVIYRETPSQKAVGFVSYTMPKPCWAVLKFEISPLPRGSGIRYKSIVPNDKILYRYQHQVEDTIERSLKQGMHGWSVTDVDITLIDGEYHVEHTHPLDFMVATPMGIMDALKNAGTNLLEPILSFELTAPNEVMNKIIGEVVRMRGEVETPIIYEETFVLTGTFPAADSIDFPTYLASVSKGHASLSMQISEYRLCPNDKGQDTPYRGINPLDRAKYILHVRGGV